MRDFIAFLAVVAFLVCALTGVYWTWHNFGPASSIPWFTTSAMCFLMTIMLLSTPDKKE